jgi:copper chaperone
MMERIVMKVDGMSCEHCVKAITETLDALPGVNEVKVSLEAKTVAFTWQDGGTPMEEIVAAIEDQGYDVV